MSPAFQKITFAQCCDVAEEVRKQYWPSLEVPVDIDHIIDIKLGLGVIPMDGLRNNLDIYGFLTSDRSAIYIDSEMMITPKFEAVLRFTMAHELGHYFLHKDFYETNRVTSVNQWKNLLSSIDGPNLAAYEDQADEFAGRLLVPVADLEKALMNISGFLKKFQETSKPHYGKEEFERIAPLYAADLLTSQFNVPFELMYQRLMRENIKVHSFIK